MSGGLSNYLKGKLADFTFGGSAFTPATTLYLCAYTVSPGATDAGTEVTVANNYGRVAVTNNLTTGFAALSSNVKNMLAQTFLQATGSWGTVVSVGLRDASSAGNLYAWADLTTAQAITTGGTLSFNTNDVNWTWS